jgi:anti-sigma B factor antagonist
MAFSPVRDNEFDCFSETRGATRVVTIVGELDVFTTPRLRGALDEAFLSGPEEIVIDLAAVTFLDSTCIHALVSANRRARTAGVSLSIVPAAAPVHRAFAIAGVDGLLSFVGSSHPEYLVVQVTRERDATRVAPAGDVDLVTAGEIEAHLQRLLVGGTKRILLDLRRVDFMDSTGLNLILRWDAASRADGFDLRVVHVPPAVKELFALTGLLDRLSFGDD